VGNSSSLARRRLDRAFFDRPTRTVAQALLGCRIHVSAQGGVRSATLVEVEAYVSSDPASHAFRGRTVRNRSMFARPGTLYVFRIHQVVCANLVTRPGQAVLLRAGAPLGEVGGNPSGPGRLCRFLGISIADDGADTCRSSRVYLTAGVGRPRSAPIRASPRVGISRGVDRELRFSVDGDPWVSRPQPRGRLT
jgi:DNA-3-methyladenine glycosylase